LSPDTVFGTSTARPEFVNRFVNSITSVEASTLALILGSLAAYGLSRFRYKFAFVGM
jgi:multiple sugar transport system permease protein